MSPDARQPVGDLWVVIHRKPSQQATLAGVSGSSLPKHLATRDRLPGPAETFPLPRVCRDRWPSSTASGQGTRFDKLSDERDFPSSKRKKTRMTGQSAELRVVVPAVS